MDALMTNIYVNKECNRRCPNCYYPHSKIKMDTSQANKVSKWLTNMYYTENVKEFRIGFLGGEPFLNIDVVFQLIDNINKNKPSTTKAAGYKGREGFVIYTNGDHITSSNLKALKERNVMIMLNPTYDGLKAIEDKIIFIKSICGGCNLAIALDWLNLERLPELTKLAIKHDSNIRTNRLYMGGTITGYVEEYRRQMTRMFKLLLEAEKPMWPNFIMETTYPTWKGKKNPNACGRWIVIIDPDGTIRSCNADLNTTIGHIEKSKKMTDFNFTHRWSAKNLPECKNCEWVTWCQGGCPYTRLLAYGTYNKRSPFCSAFKKLWPLQMKLVKKYEEKVK